MRCEGVPVGLGVDGSASNDAGNMIAEARQAMLLQRVAFGPGGMTAREALEIATLGGAKILNRDDIGSLKPGMAADFVAFHLNQIGYAGALHDPVAALIFAAPTSVALSVINGRVVVRDRHIVTIDLARTLEQHNRLSRQLVSESS
jgi:cytosine/adenosine deaminase-related metal-dependent hydrolase